MTKTVRGAIAEWNLKQEPCCNCLMRDMLGNRWTAVVPPEDFKCAVNEMYFNCPWTGVEFPWARRASFLGIVEEEEE